MSILWNMHKDKYYTVNSKQTVPIIGRLFCFASAMSYKFEPANIRNLDRQPSSFTLSFDSQAHHKSVIGGCLSICYILMVLAISIFKFLDLQNRQHVSFQVLVNKSNDVYPLNISSANLTIVLFKYTTGISSQTIKPSQQYKYGVNVSILEYLLHYQQKDGQMQQVDIQRKIPMVACDATQSQKISYFCVPKDSGMDFTILGRTDFSQQYNNDMIGYKRYSILVQQCSKDASSLCKDYSQKLFPFVRFYNNAIEQQVPNHNDTVLFQSTKRAFQPLTEYLDTSYQVRLIFYMKRVIVQTYTTTLPDFFQDKNPITTSTYFYDQQSKQQSFLTSASSKNSIVLFQAQFKRSVFTNLYRRKYKRIDQMLAQVFGLVGLLGIVIFGIYAGYNGWCFQQSIRKYFGLPHTQPTILRYYNFKIQSVLYKFCGCFFRNRQKFKKEVETQQKLRDILDYKNCIFSFEIVKQRERASQTASARNSGKSKQNKIIYDSTNNVDSLLTLS